MSGGGSAGRAASGRGGDGSMYGRVAARVARVFGEQHGLAEGGYGRL